MSSWRAQRQLIMFHNLYPFRNTTFHSTIQRKLNNRSTSGKDERIFVINNIHHTNRYVLVAYTKVASTPRNEIKETLPSASLMLNCEFDIHCLSKILYNATTIFGSSQRNIYTQRVKVLQSRTR